MNNRVRYNLSEKEANEELLTFLTNSESKIEFKAQERIKYSIIILTYNSAHWSLQCLKSLLYANLEDCEIIIIDNCSNDRTHELLNRISGAIVVINKSNIFYGGGCNQGANLAKGEFLVFLNNDLVVDSKFVSELNRPFIDKNDIGMVGGKLIFPNSLLQEAGCMIWQDGTPWGYGRGDVPNQYSYNFVREVDYCSAAMVMIRRELFLGLGGFDSYYEPAYFEDADFAMKIRQHSLKFIYNPFATAIHIEHGSANLESVINLMEKNQRKFYLRWKTILEKNHLPRKTDIFSSRERNERKRILFIDHRVPVPENGGGYPRAWDMLKTCTEMNYHVTLFPIKKDEVDTSGWLERTIELQRNGIEVVQGSETFNNFCRSRSSYFDLVIVSRLGSLRRVFEDIKSLMPSVPILFDSEAVDFIRTKGRMQFEGKFNPEEFNRLKSEELSILKLMDSVLFVSKNDRDIVLSDLPELVSRSQVLGFSLKCRPGTKSFSEREGFFFLGGFLGQTGLNEHAIEYFVNKAWKEIYSVTKTPLYIGGSNMPPKISSLAGDGICILGYINDLESSYGDKRVFVVPHQFSGGIPYKLSEALSFGLPCLVSQNIADQMGLTDGEGVLICRNEKEFISKGILLHSDEKIWNKVRNKGLEYISKTHDNNNWKRIFQLTIGSLCNR